MDLSVLPPEILTEIFLRLPAVDRKNVRFCNRLFYHCCADPKIVTQERFLITPSCSNVKIVETLLSCDCFKINLTFIGVAICKLPRCLWQFRSDRIVSLNMTDCIIDSEILTNIAINCKKLQCWELFFSVSYESIVDGLLQPAFEKLSQIPIIRNCLITFRIVLDNKCNDAAASAICKFWMVISKKVAAVFPNLKTLALIGNCYCKAVPTSFGFRLNNCSQIKNVVSSINSPNFGNILRIKDARLKEFESQIYEDDSSTFRLLIADQKKLEKLNLIVDSKSNSISSAAYKDLLINIVKASPSLRHLKFHSNARVKLDSALCLEYADISVLFQCNLKSLSIDCFHVSGQPIPLRLNDQLTTLILKERSEMKDADYLILLKHFRALRNLELSSITDNVLQLILKFQQKLKSLRVSSNDDGFTTYGVIGLTVGHKHRQSYSIKNLKHLEKLLLISSRPFELSDNVINEFSFPKLEFFSISIKTNRTNHVPMRMNKLLHHVVENSPYLKCIMFRDEVPLDILLSLFPAAKSLSVIYLHTLMDCNLSDLFNACPSLRIVQANTYSGNRIFYRNLVLDEKEFDVDNYHSTNICDRLFSIP